MTEVAPKIIAGKYAVLGVLGEGGTGVVYDAKKRDDGRSVALKVMHANLAGDKQIRGRFQREAAGEAIRRTEADLHRAQAVDPRERAGVAGRQMQG